MAATIVAIINLKGGVGKSTLAMILGEYLSLRIGERVLLIDMDAQGNLSYCMVPEHQIQTQENQGRTTYHLLSAALQGENPDPKDYLTRPPLVISNVARHGAVNHPGILDIIVSTPSVAQLDAELIDLWARGRPFPTSLRESLAMALGSIGEEYDRVIIDCPPGLSVFSSTALMACDYFVAPVIPEPLSLQGVNLVKTRVTELHQKGSAAKFGGVILNIVKHYRKTHQTTAVTLYGAQRGMYKPFDYWLPDSERLRRIGEYDPDLEGSWAGGMGQKFSSLHQKYGLSYRLNNPRGGPLDLSATEGKQYSLEDQIGSLVEEFRQRCA